MADQPQDLTLSKSRDIIESYIFSTSKRSFTMYSERLLLRIVEAAQQQVAGANFRDGLSIGQVSIGPLGEAEIEIPIRDLLGSDSSTNYTQAKNAIMELMSSPYFVERPKLRNGQPVYNAKGEQEFELLGRQILNSCEVNVKPGIAVITVNKDTWAAVLDFSKGFRKYDLEAAQSLTKATSLRLFKLLSNQRYPVTYTIAQLRKMWEMEDKYPDTYDFIKRTIEPAKKELDAKAPWSFTYKKNTAASAPENKGRAGKRAVTSVTFIPVQKQTAFSSSALIKQIHPSSLLGKEAYEMLLNKFGFAYQGIVNNMTVFEAARRSGVDILVFLTKVAPKALRAPNPPAYVIKSIKLHLKEDYGIDVDKPKITL
jgi:hypothetical protein